MTRPANSMEFIYTVVIHASSQAQADEVMTERIGYDEDYGFEYEIDFEKDYHCRSCDGHACDV